jgi:hypothetical protein
MKQLTYDNLAEWMNLGGIFVLAGWFCWSKRTPRARA